MVNMAHPATTSTARVKVRKQGLIVGLSSNSSWVEASEIAGANNIRRSVSANENHLPMSGRIDNRRNHHW
jgi:hypothetical protein